MYNTVRYEHHPADVRKVGDIEPEVKDIGGPEARREFPWFYVSHLAGWLKRA
jgi:hypothetical protein